MKTLGVGLLGLTLVVPAVADAGPSEFGADDGASAARDDARDEDEALSGEQLRERFPGLKTRAEPRVLQGAVGFGGNFIYLPLNVEGRLDLYPRPWLRVGLEYALGLGFKWNGRETDLTFAQYGEAVLGVRVLGALSEADVDLQLSHSIGGYGEALPRALRPRGSVFAANVVPVLLPSSHGLFVEGGALTGYIGLKRCTTTCGGTEDLNPQYASVARQLVMPFAGLRYVYYSEAYIPRPSTMRIRYTQVFAHVLFRPYNQPRGDLSYLGDGRVDRSALGMRVGAVFPVSPFCLNALVLGGRCAQTSLSLGYTPFPAILMFEFHALFPF